jgi:hypothetical protein
MVEPTCNIGERGIRQRLWLGAILVIGGVIASFLDRSFWGQVVQFFGFLSFFQGVDGTCVAMATRGARETDEGREMLGTVEEIEFFRRRARAVYLKTFLATLGVMIAGRAWLWVRG